MVGNTSGENWEIGSDGTAKKIENEVQENHLLLLCLKHN